VQEPEQTNGTTRRTFYVGIIYAVWGAITAALAIPAGIYLLFPPSVRKDSEWIDASDLNLIPQGEPTEVSFQHRRVDGWKVTSEKATAWIVRKDENQVIAFAPQCTHLGCAYHWEDRNHAFVCPCHSSEFSMEGAVLGGPAPRPLDRYQVKIEAGRIKIGSLEPHA
jgi:menaquinol-cytochrome c reductase iron-sulfur subunit